MKHKVSIPLIAAAIVLAPNLRGQVLAGDQQLNRAELCSKADTLTRAAQRGCADKVREFLAANGIDSQNGSESAIMYTLQAIAPISRIWHHPNASRALLERPDARWQPKNPAARLAAP